MTLAAASGRSRSLATPKSSTLTRPFGRDEDVCGLEVAMNDEVAVGVRHGRKQLLEDAQPLLQTERPCRAVLREGNAVDVLHHEVRLSGGSDAAIEERHDVGVLQRGQNLALRAEALHGVGALQPCGDELDGDVLREVARYALGPVDVAHPALPDALDEAKRSDDAADRDLFEVGRRRVGAEALVWRAVGEGNRGHERARAAMSGEQRLDFGPQGRAFAAERIEDGTSSRLPRPARPRTRFRLRPNRRASLVRTFQAPVEPRAREFPEALHGRRRHVEAARRFLNREPREIAKLHDAGAVRRDALERRERFVERDEVEAVFRRDAERVVEAARGRAPARRASARVVPGRSPRGCAASPAPPRRRNARGCGTAYGACRPA